MGTYTSEEFLDACLMWRGIDPENACMECGGTGSKAYGDTSTWRRGVGGQMITRGPCDKCWGSGDKHRPWPSHRRMESLEREVTRLRDAQTEGTADD